MPAVSLWMRQRGGSTDREGRMGTAILRKKQRIRQKMHYIKKEYCVKMEIAGYELIIVCRVRLREDKSVR